MEGRQGTEWAGKEKGGKGEREEKRKGGKEKDVEGSHNSGKASDIFPMGPVCVPQCTLKQPETGHAYQFFAACVPNVKGESKPMLGTDSYPVWQQLEHIQVKECTSRMCYTKKWNNAHKSRNSVLSQSQKGWASMLLKPGSIQMSNTHTHTHKRAQNSPPSNKPNPVPDST